MVYYSHEPLVIVFDDLTQDNYEMIDQPLNFDEIQLVIEKLAKFHALSLVLEERVSLKRDYSITRSGIF